MKELKEERLFKALRYMTYSKLISCLITCIVLLIILPSEKIFLLSQRAWKRQLFDQRQKLLVVKISPSII